MTLTVQDLEALRILIREEIHTQLEPFEAEMREFRHETQSNFDGLFKRDETREQEAVSVSHQLDKLERRVTALEHKVA